MSGATIEEAIAIKRLEFVQREYWRLRNGKQRFMRCPYCTEKARMRNFPGSARFCCEFFAKAFAAILDRQEKVDQMMHNEANRIIESAVN